MEGRQSMSQAGRTDGAEGQKAKAGLTTGAELERKFKIALVLYAVLAALAWFTLDAQPVIIAGKMVNLRLLPLIIVGGLALRTVLAWKADKIRRRGESNG